MSKLIDTIKGSETNARTPLIVEFVEGASAAAAEKAEKKGAVVMGGDRDYARLLDEATLALHVPLGKLPDPVREAICRLRRSDPLLENKQIAIVDDDIRNIFSLTSIFEQYNIRTVHAENGRDGIELLNRYPGIDAMVIDIMMPELNGYDTIKEIRKNNRQSDLPLIAITAKAMREDREECFKAGATDYLAKPVDAEELIAVLRNCLRPAKR